MSSSLITGHFIKLMTGNNIQYVSGNIFHIVAGNKADDPQQLLTISVDLNRRLHKIQHCLGAAAIEGACPAGWAAHVVTGVRA